jgi:hypothetical protein
MAASVNFNFALLYRIVVIRILARERREDPVECLRIELDRIPLGTSEPHPASKSNGRPLLRDPSAFQVPDQNLLEFANGGIVVVNEFGEFTNSATDVDCGGWVWYLNRFEYRLDAYAEIGYM